MKTEKKYITLINGLISLQVEIRCSNCKYGQCIGYINDSSYSSNGRICDFNGYDVFPTTKCKKYGCENFIVSKSILKNIINK